MRHFCARLQGLELGPAPTLVAAIFAGCGCCRCMWHAQEWRGVARLCGGHADCESVIVLCFLGLMQLGRLGSWRLDHCRPIDQVFGLFLRKRARKKLLFLVFDVAWVALFAHPKILPSRLSVVVCVCLSFCACVGACVRVCICMCLCSGASCLRLAFKRLDLQRTPTATLKLFSRTKRGGSGRKLCIHVHILARMPRASASRSMPRRYRCRHRQHSERRQAQVRGRCWRWCGCFRRRRRRVGRRLGKSKRGGMHCGVHVGSPRCRRGLCGRGSKCKRGGMHRSVCVGCRR